MKHEAMIRPVYGPPPREVRRLGVRELLEWAFGTECARLEFDEIGESSGGARRGVGIEHVLAQRAVLGGVEIDTSPGRSAPADDAEIIASVVQAALRWPDACWVADLARAGRVPDYMPFAAPRLHPLRWHCNRHGWHGKSEDAREATDGWPPQERRNRAGTLVAESVRYTPCYWSPTPAQINAKRRAYLDWYGHLLTLRVALRAAGLKWCEVSDEMPPMEPWRLGLDRSDF